MSAKDFCLKYKESCQHEVGIEHGNIAFKLCYDIKHGFLTPYPASYIPLINLDEEDLEYFYNKYKDKAICECEKEIENIEKKAQEEIKEECSKVEKRINNYKESNHKKYTELLNFLKNE